LDLLRYAGNRAETRGADKVSIEDVRLVISEMYPTISLARARTGFTFYRPVTKRFKGNILLIY
jgi:Cdc6-like AAA superfamily ATPase